MSAQVSTAAGPCFKLQMRFTHLQDPLVRDAATSALLAIYRDSEHVDSMRAFTQRFSQRFAELVYDVDEEVAVKGVGLRLGLLILAGAAGLAVKKMQCFLL